MHRDTATPTSDTVGELSQPPGCIDFLVLPKFQLLTLSLAIETLRIANRAAGREIITWRVLADGAPMVQASNGLAVTCTHRLQDAAESEFAVVCAAFDTEAGATRPVLSWLRKQERFGAVIGGLDAGPIVLAKAGLLNDVRATLHWESIPGFRERYPEIEITYQAYEIDRRRITCAGSLATFDLLLKLLDGWFGSELALRTAELLVSRSDGARPLLAQRAGDLYRRYKERRVLAAIIRMRETLDAPLGIEALARHGNLSSRQLIRLFQQHVGVTPQQHYLELRLAHADQLLKETVIPLSEVALACGFPSASAFTHGYRRVRGVPPKVTRTRGYGVIDVT